MPASESYEETFTRGTPPWRHTVEIRLTRPTNPHRIAGLLSLLTCGTVLALRFSVKSLISSGLGAAATGSALLLAVLFNAAPAQAKTAIAVDLDYAVPIDSDYDSGGGFAVRVGQQLRLPLIAITPELAFADHSFPDGPTAYRGLAGLRLGFGEIIRPGVFAHLGLGHLTLPSPFPSHTAFTYDAGVFLDLTVIPLLDLGIHGGYNRLNEGEGVAAFDWATIGAHAALVF